MPEITRTGQMYHPLIGFTVANRSLAGRGRPLYPLRLIHLQATPLAFWGNALTWAMMEILGIAWGDNETIRYVEPQPGWTYEWDRKTKVFTVTSDAGEIEKYSADTLSDLGISWAILESSQFYIYPQGRSSNEVFLIGTRTDVKRTGDTQQLNSMNIDYLRGTQHAVYDFLSGIPVTRSNWPDAGEGGEEGGGGGGYIIDVPEGNLLPIELNSASDPLNILLARTNEINFTGDYPVNIYKAEQYLLSTRKVPIRASHTRAMTLLMVRLFASRLLSPLNSKIVYEPWMLWEIFKWVFVRPAAGKRERIFDLSPWWG